MVKRREYHPFLDEGLKRWIYKTAQKNEWRVSSYMDIDDLIQEGFLAYAICRARYQDRVKNQSHFMSLVKVTFINQITDLANKRTRTLETPICDIAEMGNDQELLETLAGAEDGDAELHALLSYAPAEVRLLLAALSSDEGAQRLRRPSRLRQDGTRETTNERFCRILGIPTFDIQGALREALA